MSPAASNSEARKREAARNAAPDTTGLREAVEREHYLFVNMRDVGCNCRERMPDLPKGQMLTRADIDSWHAAHIASVLAAHPDPTPEPDCHSCHDGADLARGWECVGCGRNGDVEAEAPEPDATVSDPVALTDAESVAFDWHDATCPEGAECRDRFLHATCGGGAALPTIERIVAARVAEAVEQERDRLAAVGDELLALHDKERAARLALVAKIRKACGWGNGRDTGGVDRLVPASELRAILEDGAL